MRDLESQRPSCLKAGFVRLGEYDFEYPPGNVMRCNDWVLTDG
jgi:hypothetical protein